MPNSNTLPRGCDRRIGAATPRPPRRATSRSSSRRHARPSRRSPPGRRSGLGHLLELVQHRPEPFRHLVGDLHHGERARLDRRAFGRSHERAGLVDPHRHRHVRDAEEFVDAVVAVDERRMGGRCPLDPGTGLLGVKVEGDSDDAETSGSSSSSSACHTGRSAEQPRHDAQRRGAPFVPASRSGRTGCRRRRAVRSVGRWRGQHRPPLSGPSAQIAASSSATSGVPVARRPQRHRGVRRRPLSRHGHAGVALAPSLRFRDPPGRTGEGVGGQVERVEQHRPSCSRCGRSQPSASADRLGCDQPHRTQGSRWARY